MNRSRNSAQDPSLLVVYGPEKEETEGLRGVKVCS